MEHILENSFRDIALKETDIELYEFNKAIAILEYIENNNVNEGTISDFLSKVSSNIKKKIDFIKELAEMTKNKLKDLLIMFKDTRVFKFFKVIGFNIKKLGLMIKKGIDAYNSIQDIIAKKIYDMGGVQYIRKNLHELDEFFKSHPVIKKIGGIAVAGLLLYIWLNMSYDPIDVEWSLSFEDMIKALAGNYSLAELFAEPGGIKMLIYLVIGMTTGGVWYYPGSQMSQIMTGVIYSLWKTIIKDKSATIPRPKFKKHKI
jgi:uncharacterized protein YjiS (DUF1127 family)